MNEFCPRCNALKSMDSILIERDNYNSEGNPVKEITTNYYCSDCHSFVCSENKIAKSFYGKKG